MKWLASTAIRSVRTGAWDETYARIRGRWHYIYRAIDGFGQIVDACVSPTRDMTAACRFFGQAIASSQTTPRRVITDTAGRTHQRWGFEEVGGP
jgi:transposase-like protein